MSNELHNKLELVKDSVKKAKREIDTDWLDIKEQYNFDHSGESLRKYSVGWKLLEEWGLINYNNVKIEDDKLPTYKETTEYKSDGSYISDKLVKLADDDLKNPEKLLEVHGFDKNKWQLTNAKNSMWNSGLDNTLHSSRITVKPIVDGFDIEKVLEKVLKQEVKIIKVDKKDNSRKGNLLVIPLVDAHFGINSYEEYKEAQVEIIELIQSKTWEAIYFNIGNDLLHCDGFSGQTTSGTHIEQVDIEKAWYDAFKFYCELIVVALENSENVFADYICGNHDKVITYGLVKSLEVKFPQVKWDSSIKNKKLFVWEQVALYSAHGDKGSNRLSKALLAEYGKVIAKCDCVEILTGHLHFSQTKDDHGIVSRTLSTKAKTDTWHSENSFVGSRKQFQILEYTNSSIKTIYHV